jgi:hypothetical protein
METGRHEAGRRAAAFLPIASGPDRQSFVSCPSLGSHHRPPGSLVLSPQQPFHWPQLKHFHLANHHFIGNPHTGHGGMSIACLGSIRHLSIVFVCIMRLSIVRSRRSTA